MDIQNIVRDKIGDIFGRAGVTNFSMHVQEGKSVQKGQFLLAVGDNRVILARVVDIETRMTETVAKCEILGECIETSLKQCNRPVRAGYEIYNPSGDFLSKVITRTTREKGLYIGKILTHPDFVPVYYNPKDLRVHVLVTATTGGGKSYTLSVFIEELIKKMRENKNLSIIIFDVHDEYSGLVAPNKNPKQVEILKKFNLEPIGFEDDILIFDWENNPPYLDPIFSPDRLMFLFSMRELRHALQLKQLMGDRSAMHVNDLFKLVEISDLHPQTKQALLTRIGALRDSGFLSRNYIKHEDFCVPGKLTIFRLVGTPLGDLGIRFFVADITRQIFENKKLGKIKHNVVIVVDEAHLFAPAKGKDDPVKEILVRVSREGRKMGVWLILATQSPRDLSDVIIINCSTIIALKMQRHDIKKLSQIFGISKKLVEVLTQASPGECFVKAPSFTIPIMVKIRARQSSELKGEGVDVGFLMQKIKEIAIKTRNRIAKHKKITPEPQVKPPQPPPTASKPQPVYPSAQPPQRPSHVARREPIKSEEIIEVKPTYPTRRPPRRPSKKMVRVEEIIDYTVNIFADQIRAHDDIVLNLISALLVYDAMDIIEALKFASEDVIDALVADEILRYEDSYIVLNLDRKIEELLGRRVTETDLALAKRKLRSLLGI